MIEVGGPPERWISKDGMPATAVLGWPHAGMPSYESEHGLIAVMDLLVVMGEDRTIRQVGNAAAIDESGTMFSRDYRSATIRSTLAGDHELTALHDNVDAVWSWRPLVYRVRNGGIQRLGSQQEIEMRWNLSEVIMRTARINDELVELALRCSEEGATVADAMARFHEYKRAAMDEPYEYVEANVLADRILREHLSAQQIIDLDAWGRFYVRGTINKLYRVELGNGAAIVNPRTRHEMITLCLHPERWMPHADVALATKLLIDSGPEGEEELLAGARARPQGAGRGAWRIDRMAWDIERELLPAPYAA